MTGASECRVSSPEAGAEASLLRANHRDWDCVSLLVSDPVTQGRDLLCPMKTTPATTVVLSHSTVPSAGSEPRLPWFTQLPHVTLASYLAPLCLSYFNCKMEFL